MRLINWSFAWHLLGGDAARCTPRAMLRERWLTSIFQHCHFIAGHFSRHSSANNHLLGELTGLFVAATTWPLWPQSQSWRETAQRELRAAGAGAERQRTASIASRPSGITTKSRTCCSSRASSARANGMDFAAEYWQRLEAMLDFIASIMDVGGNVPNFGDADDAIIARLDPAPDAHVYRSLLATGAVVFGRADFKLKAGTFDDKSRWLLGDRAAGAIRRAVDRRRGRRRRGANSRSPATTCSGSEFDTPREVRIVADAGPLGYLSIAAHGHADALSFTLSAGGAGAADRSRHVRVSHAEAVARLLPRHVGAQHRAHRRAGPVGRRRKFPVAGACAGPRARVRLDAAVRSPGRRARRLSAPARSGDASARAALDHADRDRDRRRRDLLPRVAHGGDVLAFRGRLRSDARWRARRPRAAAVLDSTCSCRRACAASWCAVAKLRRSAGYRAASISARRRRRCSLWARLAAMPGWPRESK